MAAHLQLLKGLIKSLFCFNAVVKNIGHTCYTVVNNLTLLTTEVKDLLHNSVLALLYVRTMFFSSHISSNYVLILHEKREHRG